MVNQEIERIVFIGAGNLATQLAQALHRAGYNIAQVYSRTVSSACALAEKVKSDYCINTHDIIPDADLYIFAVSDGALESLACNINTGPNALWVHTAGSMPMSIFEGYHKRYGIFYPLQTLSKERQADFSTIPVFIEAKESDDLQLLRKTAEKISHNVRIADSEQRRQLHLAAVFACNFTNHMYAIAAELLARKGLPIDALRPLIKETAAKTETMSPLEAQTGPAIRYDYNVMQKHIELLQTEEEKEIYRLISQHIHRYAGKKNR